MAAGLQFEFLSFILCCRTRPTVFIYCFVEGVVGPGPQRSSPYLPKQGGLNSYTADVAPCPQSKVVKNRFEPQACAAFVMAGSILNNFGTHIRFREGGPRTETVRTVFRVAGAHRQM